MAGGMCNEGGGHVWQEKWQLQRAVHILLEYILVCDDFSAKYVKYYFCK